MGMIGGWLRAGDKPEVTRLVKNNRLQKLIRGQISEYGSLKAEEDSALESYLAEFLAGQGAAESRTGQEIGAVDAFYNGDMERQLANLRSTREKAVTDAATLSSKYALANLDRSRLGSEGGSSSYDKRIASRTVGDIGVQAALDKSSQERADLGYLTGNRIGLAGQRTALADQLAGRQLVPANARASMFARQGSRIAALTQNDQANKFYGVGMPTNSTADTWDAIDQGILNVLSTYSGSPNQGGGDLASKSRADFGQGDQPASSSGGGGGGGWGGDSYLRNYYDEGFNGGGGGYDYGSNFYDEGFSEGGKVDGPGTATSDSIPIRVSDDEFIVRAAAVRLPGVRRILEVINALGEDDAPSVDSKKMPKGYAWGGQVKQTRKGYRDGGAVRNGDQDAMVKSRLDRDLSPSTFIWGAN